LGELLNDGKGARGSGVVTLARGQQPLARLSPPRPSNQRRLRVSLFAADALLGAGALVFLLRHPAPDVPTTAVCVLAVLLGAWLGWCGLTLAGPEA
jgi:hypothetical protein